MSWDKIFPVGTIAFPWALDPWVFGSIGTALIFTME